MFEHKVLDSSSLSGLLATVPVLDEFAVRYSLFATAAGCLGLPASNRVQR